MSVHSATCSESAYTTEDAFDCGARVGRFGTPVPKQSTFEYRCIMHEIEPFFLSSGVYASLCA